MESWRAIQRNNFTCIRTLADFLELSLENTDQLLTVPTFPLNLPYRLAKKMEKNNLNDPLLLQFLPLKKENISTPGFCKEPVQDSAFQKTPRLLQKYAKRALLMPTSACVMNCRFCFRKNYPYEKEGGFSYENELSILQNTPSIKEVILSGGDPLSLSDRNLSSLLLELNTLTHIHTIRFHTRFPIGIPERISKELLHTLSQLTKKVVFALHINHPSEIDIDVEEAVKKLKPFSTAILMQTVLLKGVNSDKETLVNLMEKAFNASILPYYLHQLDNVEGAGHFSISPSEASSLFKHLQENLPGYCVPRMVREIPFEKHKTWIL